MRVEWDQAEEGVVLESCCFRLHDDDDDDEDDDNDDGL